MAKTDQMLGKARSLNNPYKTIRDDVEIKWQEVDGLDQTIRDDVEIKWQEVESH